MMTPYVILATFALLLAMASVIRWSRAFANLRGARVITCPETGRPAGVELKALAGAARAIVGEPSLSVKDCSRWPGRLGCGQECLKQIHEAPDGCLVRSMLTRWYLGKSCILCHKDLSPEHWPYNKPALRKPDGTTVEWGEVPPAQVPEVLSTHRPICFDCHVVQRLCRLFPERIVVRPPHSRHEA